MYLGESQRTFDEYVSQVDLVFWTKSLTYASKKAKYLYAIAFLGGIPQHEWVAKNQRIKADPDRGYNYLKFVFFLQEHKLPAHVQTANLIVRIERFQQRNNQSVPEFIAYLNKLKFQMAPIYKNRQRQDYLFCTLHKYIWYSIIKQGKSWETKTKLK